MTKHYVLHNSTDFESAVKYIKSAVREKVAPELEITVLNILREDGTQYYKHKKDSIEEANEYIQSEIDELSRQNAFGAFSRHFIERQEISAQEYKNIITWATAKYDKLAPSVVKPAKFNIMYDVFKEYDFEQVGVTSLIPKDCEKRPIHHRTFIAIIEVCYYNF